MSHTSTYKVCAYSFLPFVLHYLLRHTRLFGFLYNYHVVVSSVVLLPFYLDLPLSLYICISPSVYLYLSLSRLHFKASSYSLMFDPFHFFSRFIFNLIKTVQPFMTLGWKLEIKKMSIYRSLTKTYSLNRVRVYKDFCPDKQI